MKVLEICGSKGFLAFQSFNHLMLGLKMLPAYLGETYEDFLDRITIMEPSDQMKMIREAAMFVKLEEDELKAIICFCTDKNGVPYSSENLKSLNPAQIIDIVCEVCFRISQFKITFVSESEKKNSEILA